MALVNKLHPLPEGWEDALETVTITNSIGDEVEVEKKAYDAYQLLKADLEKNDGVYLELDSARRSVAEQQRIMDDFTAKYGADYAAKTVATPGYSEHHTGLALDLYFRLNGKDVYENEDMVQYPEIWEKIHKKLADYGFILRYLRDKEYVTGYGYEPWHIRYIDSVDTAREIMAKGVTFEGYLGAAVEGNPTVDYGTSTAFTKEELEEAVVQIKCQFASYNGCELKSIRYAGDETNNETNLAWLNDGNEGEPYVACAEFLMNFHSPKENNGPLEPDFDYNDYQWWLARTKDGGWEVADRGFGSH
ncbi:MAG: M15 family metallopeptidase [Acutalibacteraceae bacterium]|jgi:LAS superfamily LD-carboxypeptidase LdcB